MPYIVANHFELGLDLRKSALTAPSSSFRDLRNCVVNAGGEIEKRKAFVKIYTNADPLTIGGLAGDNDKFFLMKKSGASTTPIQLSGPLYSLGIDANAAIIRFDSYQPWAAGFIISGDTGDQKTRRQYYNGVVIANAAANAWRSRVFQTKVYAVTGQNLDFSAVSNPGNWDSTVTPANGAGFINVAGADQFHGDIVSIDRYYTDLAVFGVNDIQVWQLDPDPKLSQILQTVGNTGLIAPRAHAQYSTGDVLYASRSGVRSLKARDSSNYAVTSDVGSPVDTIVQGYLQANIAGTRYPMQAVVEPETGSFWLAMGSQILVFSFFPTSKISAWSIFDLPFSVDDMAVNRESLAVRSGSDIYLYGGTDHATYDTTQATITTPFLDAKLPATHKLFQGIDVGCQGTWSVNYNVNPSNEAAFIPTAVITGTTFPLDKIPMQGASTHIAMQFQTSDQSKALLSSYVVHYAPTEEG